MAVQNGFGAIRNPKPKSEEDPFKVKTGENQKEARNRLLPPFATGSGGDPEAA